MGMPMWVVALIKKGFPHLFTVSKLTRVPALGKAIDYALFDGDDMVFLPKDKAIEIGRTVDAPPSVVLPSQVAEHFAQAATHRWIMNACICRDSLKCKNHPIDLGCLFLGEAVLEINPKLGRLVSEQEALAHLRRCREAGLVHLVGRNKLDTVWLNVGPGRKLLTICNCCSCCCLWRAAPYLSPEIAMKVKKLPGVGVRITDRCSGCGACARKVCFVDAIRLVDERAEIGALCRGCGRCVEVCPEGAIEISIDGGRVVKDSIAHISSLVDVS